MPFHMNIGESVRGSASDLQAAIRDTISGDPVRGFLNFFVVGLISVVLLFPLMRKIPVVQKVVPR